MRVTSKDPNRLNRGKWFDEKYDNGLHYNQVYEILDELTAEGFTPFQIQEILKLGREEYKKRKA